MPSLVWLVPLAAALICIALVVRYVSDRGPAVTISFSSAEGLEAGKTKIRYKNVDIGRVTGVRLSRDRARVLVKAPLTQLTRTLQSLNQLADYLERHPESLLSGKSGDAQP